MTEFSEPIPRYREWVAVSTIASAMQRKCILPWGGIEWYPNLFIILVSPPGKGRKGTAIGFGRDMLLATKVPLAPQSITREALIADMIGCETVHGGKGWVCFHSSMTIISKELTVFLSEREVQLMQDMQDWYDCDDPWIYRTKGAGDYPIRGMCVNLLSATTPELMQKALPKETLGGGWASRTIFVYSADKGKRVAVPFLTKEQKILKTKLIEDLKIINGMAGQFRVDDSFLDAYIPWYSGLDTESEGASLYVASYLERKATHLMKVCMVHNAARTQSMVMSAEDFFYARNLLDKNESMLGGSFSMAGGNPDAALLERILEVVRRKGKERATNLYRILNYEASPERIMKVIVDARRMGFLTYTACAGDFILESVED
jgi:hypothetical protein